jgi:DnaJ-class molecular chaperone
MIADLTYYKLLEVEPNTTDKEIRASYKKLCTKYHPDKNTKLHI